MAAVDVLIIGGGVVGLTIALAVRDRDPSARIALLEKETDCGMHASGRNSGVVHAGFYYTADSLKARFTRAGNQALQAWCRDRGLPLRTCGKLVVARDEADLPVLEELFRRGQALGIPLDRVAESEVRAIEPRARTLGWALYSPSTASIDPGRVIASLADDARRQGVALQMGTRWLGRRGTAQHTSAGTMEAGFVINAAGLYADRVAAAWGIGKRWRILPFKGLYLIGNEPPLACHVYPVPDLGMPFLGVHVTVTADGRSKIGPTALPALWREQYEGLAGFSVLELADVLGREARLFATNPSFRTLAAREVWKARRLVDEAARLVQLDTSRWSRWGRPGIRAQLLDTATGTLEMDFVVERGARSLHVLNAVSPAFTCSFPFARWVVAQMDDRGGEGRITPGTPGPADNRDRPPGRENPDTPH